MKKLLIVLITVVSLGLVASLALACMWDGYRGDSRGSYSGGYASGMTSGTYQNFLNDTATLRQGLAAKQGEYSVLMARPNPDPKRIGQLNMSCDYFPYFPWFGRFFSGGPLSIILWVLVILIVVLLVMKLSRFLKLREAGLKRDREDSLDILKARYARGELRQTEYLKMKNTLFLP